MKNDRLWLSDCWEATVKAMQLAYKQVLFMHSIKGQTPGAYNVKDATFSCNFNVGVHRNFPNSVWGRL